MVRMLINHISWNDIESIENHQFHCLGFLTGVILTYLIEIPDHNHSFGASHTKHSYAHLLPNMWLWSPISEKLIEVTFSQLVWGGNGYAAGMWIDWSWGISPSQQYGICQVVPLRQWHGTNEELCLGWSTPQLKLCENSSMLFNRFTNTPIQCWMTMYLDYGFPRSRSVFQSG